MTLLRAKVAYFRIYDLRSTYATRLSAGGVTDEWVPHLLGQGDAKVFKKCPQMKLQMKRELWDGELGSGTVLWDNFRQESEACPRASCDKPQ